MQQGDSSDHLLQTLTAERSEGRVLDLSAAGGSSAEPLTRLGFERVSVPSIPERLPFEDEGFDWVIAIDTLETRSSREQILDLLCEVRRVLKPGGRMYVTAPAVPEVIDLDVHGYAGDSGLEPTFTPATLTDLCLEMRFAEIEKASVALVNNRRVVRAVFEKPISEGA